MYYNEVYTLFSFVGFVLCAIPLYWHLEAWNTGTCMYMIWTGLGCLVQSINSIVWNKNMINRVPVYCDIATRMQVALNVAIPACSLCINRRLYKIATVKAVMITREEKRRAVIYDLLICLGIPLIQIPAQYIVSSNRYDIFEDFGPVMASANTTWAFILFYSWPVVIGCVSCFYCVVTTYSFYNRQRQFNQLMSASQGLTRSRYMRLMAIGFIEVLGTIPIGTYIIVYNARLGIVPYVSWAHTHSNYSQVAQVPSSIWRNEPSLNIGAEMYRWLLVTCAFVFFALFGFADEARNHYRRVYTSLASRIGYSTFTLSGSSHGTTSVPHLKSKGGVTVSVVTDKRRSSVSFADQHTIPSISIANDIKLEPYSPSNSMASSSVESFDETKMQGQSTLPAGTTPTAPPASVQAYIPHTTHPYANHHAV